MQQVIIISFYLNFKIRLDRLRNSRHLRDRLMMRYGKRKNSRYFLRCNNDSCCGRASSDVEFNCVKPTKAHSYKRNPSAEIVVQFKRTVQKRLWEEGTDVPRIIEEESLKVLQAHGTNAGWFVPDNNIGRGLHYERLKAFEIDKLPLTQSDIQIAGCWSGPTTHDHQ